MNHNHKSQDSIQDPSVWNNWMTVMNAAEPYLEEGQYVAELVGAQISRSKTSNRPQVDVKYQIEGSGKEAHSFYVLDSEKGIAHLKRWGYLLGVTPTHDPREIAEFLNYVVSQRFRCLIQIIQNAGFAYALLLKKIDREPEPVTTGCPVTPVSPPSAAVKSHFLIDDLL